MEARSSSCSPHEQFPHPLSPCSSNLDEFFQARITAFYDEAGARQEGKRTLPLACRASQTKRISPARREIVRGVVYIYSGEVALACLSECVVAFRVHQLP